MRTFETTHSWIKFKLEPKEFTPELWMLLGECQSKCEHIAGVPLLPETAEKINQHYLIRGTKATTAIEGNPLSEEQVKLSVEGQLTLPPSQAYLAQEVRNIAFALGKIFESTTPTFVLSKSHVCQLNEWVLQDLPDKQSATPGQIRKHAIAVGLYRGAPAGDCEFLLDRMSQWINTLAISNQAPMVNGIVKALLTHLYIAWIHPFADGNGRTARLAEYQILLASGVPAPTAHLLSNHYNSTRSEYYQRLEDTSISGGKVMPFLTYALTGFRDDLIEQLQYVREQQVEIMWRDFVFNSIGNSKAAADRRRFELMADITAYGKPVIPKNVGNISMRMAQAYSKKTAKTVARDIAELKRLKLLTTDSDGNLIPNKRIILSYLPPNVFTE